MYIYLLFSVAYTTLRRIIGLINNKFNIIWNEAIVASYEISGLLV